MRGLLNTTLFSSDEKILSMESDLLFSNFENDKTSQEIQEHIQAMSCGKAVFQAKTLGFVYHGLLTKKRRAIQEPVEVEPQETPESPWASSSSSTPDEPETTVYCTRAHLPKHSYGVSELLLGLYCPSCNEYGKNGKGEPGRPFTRCGHCGTLRDTVEFRCCHCNTPFK